MICPHCGKETDSAIEIKLGDLTLNLLTRTLYDSTGNIHLTNYEYRLLKVLMQCAPAALLYSVLEESVWGKAQGSTHRIKVLTSKLRGKIGNGYIVTYRCFGLGFCTTRGVVKDTVT